MGLAEFPELPEFPEVAEVDGFADLLLLPLLLLLLLVEPLDLFFELEEPLLDLLSDLFPFEFVLLSDFCGVLLSLRVFSRKMFPVTSINGVCYTLQFSKVCRLTLLTYHVFNAFRKTRIVAVLEDGTLPTSQNRQTIELNVIL